MSWRERIGPATFRGVPFFVETSELSGGRRGVTHEYPLRNEPYREDLGRKARPFTIEGYVLGEDYFPARDALITALEKEGPGELVHPYHGTRRVAVGDGGFRVRESSRDGGMAFFSIEFIETPANPAQPTAIPDAAGKLRTTAAAARIAVGASFVAKYISDATLTSSTAGVLRSATLVLNNSLATASMPVQELASLKRRADLFSDSVDSILDAPEDILEGIIDLFDGAQSGDAMLDVYAADPGVRPPATTQNRLDEQTNFDATQRVTQQLALIRAAELVLDQVFDSYDAAVAAREAITDLLDEQAELAADDAYPVLVQLRADLAQAVPGESGDLPRLLSHTPPLTVPSLVLTHRLYGNLDREADLLARNKISHPGYVTGGRELEILSDE